MKKTLIALSLAAFAMGSAAPAFAAAHAKKAAACKPAKKGYELKDGKCVKMKAEKKK